MKDVQFEQTRKALHSKQRDLKRKGKGNNPNASAALSEEDIQVPYEKIPWEVPLQKRSETRCGSTTQSISGFAAARNTEKCVGEI